MKPGEYNRTEIRHRRFHELAAEYAELEILIWEGGSCGPFESSQPVVVRICDAYWLSIYYSLRDI
jgi:hypothetical protein